MDEDGSDKYCRWCGQGGTLFLCSDCTAGFCKKCIKRNLSRSVLKDVESNDWECFCCKVEPLYDLRAQAWAAQQHSKSVVINLLCYLSNMLIIFKLWYMCILQWGGLLFPKIAAIKY